MAANMFQLEIVTPSRLLFTEEAREVVVPGEEGEFGVLIGHTPFFTALQCGMVTIFAEDEERYVAVGRGFVEVTGTKVTILTKQALFMDEIKMPEIQEEAKALENELKTVTKEQEGYNSLRERYEYALAQVKTANAKKTK